jgi:hypothetical protein
MATKPSRRKSFAARFSSLAAALRSGRRRVRVAEVPVDRVPLEDRTAGDPVDREMLQAGGTNRLVRDLG